MAGLFSTLSTIQIKIFFITTTMDLNIFALIPNLYISIK